MSFAAAPDPPRAFAATHLEKKGPSTYDTDVSSNRAQTLRPAQAAPQPKGEQPTLRHRQSKLFVYDAAAVQALNPYGSSQFTDSAPEEVWNIDQSAKARPNRGLEQ